MAVRQSSRIHQKGAVVSDEVDALDQDLHYTHPVLHVIAPLAAIGATLLARKVLDIAYKQITGHAPPQSDDPSVRFSRALAWTVISAGSAAVVEMVIYRAAGRMSPRPEDA